MAYTSFSAVRTWDGSEAVSIHGATAALGASIDGALVPSFATEAARNTAAAPLIADGKTGMTCYVKSRLGTCTYIGIPAGGEPPINGWIWQAQSRIAGSVFKNGFVIGTTGNIGIQTPCAVTVKLAGGQRLINVAYQADVQPSNVVPNQYLCSAVIDLEVGGSSWADVIRMSFPGGIPAGLGGFYVTSGHKNIFYKQPAGTYTYSMRFWMFHTGGGYIDIYNPRITVIDMGPID